jgi:hypothetical protein
VRYCILCLTFLLSLPGLADSSTDDHGDLLEQGKAAYRAVALREAAVLFRDAAEQAATDDARAEALVWAGVAAGQAGELAIARRAFDDALRASCITALPAPVSPKVSEVFAAAVAAHPCEPKPKLDDPHDAPRQSGGPEGGRDERVPPPRPEAPPMPQPPPPHEPFPMGLALTAGGGVIAAVGAAVGLKAVVDIAAAADPRTPQVDARALLDSGNTAIAIASVTVGVGVAFAVVGAVLLGAETTTMMTIPEPLVPRS